MEGDVTGEALRRAVTPDDLFRFRFLLDARLSPDGERVAYVVQTTVAENGKERDCSAIWLQNIATGATFQLTSGLSNDNSPSWSADGEKLAFVSNRAGKNQVYVISAGGGEGRAVTAMVQGTGAAPVWSPDGAYIAFTAPPQIEPRQAGVPYRVTRHTYRFDNLGWVDDIRQSIYVVAAAGGEAKRLTYGGYHCSSLAWSPDSKEILHLFGLRPDSYLPSPIRAGLGVVDIEGTSRVLVEEWGNVGSATWSTDGSRVYLRRCACGHGHRHAS